MSQNNMNNMNNSGMYPQFPNGQAMQTPQGHYPQYAMPQAHLSPQSQQPPPWAISMMEDLKGSISKMDKIDSKMNNLEKMVSTLTCKLTTLEESVQGIDKRLQDVEKSSSFLSDQFEKQSKELKDARSKVNSVDQSCQQMKVNVNNLEQSCSTMNEKILDAEFRSMRDNLIFYGLSEATGTPMETSNPQASQQPEGGQNNIYDQETQQCTDKVKHFIQNTLKINATNMKFERAHRLGSNTARKPRPIIVKFHYHQDRERVRKSSFSMKYELKRQNVGVGVQIPKEWRDSRQKIIFIDSRPDDVPCEIQEIPFPCPHGEFRDIWPGPPRDLAAEQVFSMDKTWPWLANFTWKPPYDSSISSLTGFFITINTVVTNLPVIQHPKCFFANLSGTDWSTVNDPYSVLFHFDCVRVQMKTYVHMMLTSSPVPHENPGTAEAKIHLGVSEPNTKKLKIKYEVQQSDVKVNFDPLTPNTSYFVCLSQHKNYYRSCDKSVNTTKSPVVFRDVQRDNYTIMIKPSTENSLFYATTFFFVPGPPEVEKIYIDFTILSVIMACLILVTMATTIAFCFMRKQQRCVPGCIKKCREKSLYQPTPTNIPNNAPDENEGIEIYLVCMEGESYKFDEAKDSVLEFLKRWGPCQIKSDIASLLQNHGTCQLNEEIIHDKKFIFFLSDKMIDLTSYPACDLETDADVTVHSRFVSRLLREDVITENQKICVSFHSNKSSEMEDISVLNLTKLVEGKSRPDIGLHVDTIHQLLKKVGSTNLDLTRIWSESAEITNMLAKMKEYLSNYKKEEINIYRSHSQLSDHGYESRVTEESQSNGDVSQTVPNVHAEILPTQIDLEEKNDRLQETQRWAESQSQIHPSYGNQFYPSQNQIEYHKVPGVNLPATYMGHHNIDCYTSTNFSPREYLGEITGVRLQGTRKELPPSRNGSAGITQHIDWVPPFDDDTESISFSVICERQQELNDSYKHSMTSASRV